jgi:hypothetical protein
METLWVFSRNGETTVAWATVEAVALMSEQGYTCTQAAGNCVAFVQIMDESDSKSGKAVACFAL